MLQTILLQRGVTGLYAGVSAPLVAVVPAFALSFSTFEAARTAQLQYRPASARTSVAATTTDGYTPTIATVDQLSLSQTALAGAISGVPVALVLGPLEMLKCRLQMMPANAGTTRVSLTDCLRQTLHEGGGIRTLFRGTGLTVLRDVPGNAVYFGTYEFLKRTLSQWEGTSISTPSIGVTVLAGGSAGVMNWIVAIPIDVVKSQWQVTPVGVYRSPWHIVSHLLHTEGPTALFRGLGPALMRAFPANAACLLGVETARKVLGPVNV